MDIPLWYIYQKHPHLKTKNLDNISTTSQNHNENLINWYPSCNLLYMITEISPCAARISHFLRMLSCGAKNKEEIFSIFEEGIIYKLGMRINYFSRFSMKLDFCFWDIFSACTPDVMKIYSNQTVKITSSNILFNLYFNKTKKEKNRTKE